MINFDSLKIREATSGELIEIDKEYQAGMELASWFAKLGTKLSTDDIIKGLSVSLDSIDKGVNFPIAEYNNYREITGPLCFAFGEILHKEYNWKWYFMDDFYKEHIGWIIVSPQKHFGITISELFYKKIMYHKDIHFENLYELIKSGKIDKEYTQGFQFYEPWNLNK